MHAYKNNKQPAASYMHDVQLRVRVKIMHKVSHQLYMHVAMYQYVKVQLTVYV